MAHISKWESLDQAFSNFINGYGDPFEPKESYELETSNNLKKLCDAFKDYRLEKKASEGVSYFKLSSIFPNDGTGALLHCHFDYNQIPATEEEFHITAFNWGEIAAYEGIPIIIQNVDFGKLFAALSATGQDVAELKKLRNKVAARALTDFQLIDEIYAVDDVIDTGFGEGGGSPGEWWYERADELENERKRRELEGQLQRHDSCPASTGGEHHAE